MGELEFIRGIGSATRTAVITGPAAAKLRGLKTLDRVDTVDLLLPGDMRAPKASTWPDGVVYRSGALLPEHVVMEQGLRVASTIQTVLDTCRYHSPLASLVVLESARFRRPDVTCADLLSLAATLPRSHGLRNLRRVIRYSAATSQSALETVGRYCLIEAQVPGLASIRGQAPFEYYDIAGNPLTGRIDLLLNGFIAVELDGRSKYTSEIVTADERIREKQLLSHGYLVIRANWRQVWSGALALQVAHAIRRVRFLGDDPYSGNVPAPLNDGELARRRALYRR
ncbi:hypothetical protein [Corynebacterium auris]|uniref:hypothetical protein n=1 Tax=Corynebacterium auris TaxID=44750 RepID=UPI0025B5767D|nr:hypothetical protein [Corynebacterium auris]WJY68487.1 hypothetical protein CAURIS_07970 [Corynebacterium auris]